MELVARMTVKFDSRRRPMAKEINVDGMPLL